MSKKAKASSKNSPSISFLPLLTKPGVAIGKYAAVPGKHWQGCPGSDKEKRFLCSTLEFVAVHDFGDRKGAAFKMKEMGVRLLN